MNTIQIDPRDTYLRNLFLGLPFRLYKDIPQWVPPLDMDARRMLDPGKHPFYKYGRAAFFLALDEKRIPIGRLAVLANDHYNQFNHARTAFFYLFECVNDSAVSYALFEQAFAWSSAQGLDRIIGPKGFTVFDGMGMLIKGFDHRPAFGLPYNPDYYPKLVEASGFVPSGEMVSGYLNASMTFPEKIHQVSELVQKRRGLRIVRFKNRLEFSKIIPSLQTLYNEAIEGTTGNIPLTKEDVKTLADQLFWFADPKLIKIIMKEDTPAGFLLAYPDVSAAVQRCKGRVFPFGWIGMLIEAKRTHWANVNGAAIIEKYRGQGATAILFSEIYKSLIEGKFEHADLVQIGVENEKMQLELRSLGIDFYKIHRLYQRTL